jgi:hypothetical protein
VPRSKPESGLGWEDVNQRLTFYCPPEVAAAIEAAMAANGQSKTRVIVDALRAQLFPPGLLDDEAAHGVS